MKGTANNGEERPLLIKLTPSRKETIARWVRFAPIKMLMRLAIHVVVARHRLGVAVVGLDERRRILMLKHVFHPISPWGLPGGWLGRHEDPATCALRELKEETGLSAVLGPIVHISSEKKPAHLVITFLAQIQPGPMRLSSEIIEAGWFSYENRPSPLLKNVEEALRIAMVKAHSWELSDSQLQSMENN